MSDVLADLSHLTIILTGIILVLAKWRWIKAETIDTWDEHSKMRHRSKVLKKRAEQAPPPLPPAEPVWAPDPEPEPEPLPGPETFVIYKMEDGSLIDDHSWVSGLEWFDERDGEVRLIKRTYALISEELVVLPDPYPVEEDDDEP